MNIKELAKEAQIKGICNPGLKRILSSNDKESLIKYMVEGLDFCLSENFPSVEYLENNGKGLMEKHGIHVNEKCSLTNRSRSVLLGACEAEIHLDGYSVADIFLKHTSKATLVCKDNSFVRIDCFDTSEISISATGNAKVFIHVFGNGKATYQNRDKSVVKVIEKRKERY